MPEENLSQWIIKMRRTRCAFCISIRSTLLVGTDANPGGFAPAVDYETSFHREMQLLMEAGLPPLEVLQGAAGKIAAVFI